MSAFVCCDDHIVSLAARYCAKRNLLPKDARIVFDGSQGRFIANATFAHEDIRAVAQVLLDWNLKSVNTRYPNNPEEDRIVGMTSKAIMRGIDGMTPIETIKACQCYAYQACEHEDWDDVTKCTARYIINTIESQAIRALPGYDEASWELPICA